MARFFRLFVVLCRNWDDQLQPPRSLGGSDVCTRTAAGREARDCAEPTPRADDRHAQGRGQGEPGT